MLKKGDVRCADARCLDAWSCKRFLQRRSSHLQVHVYLSLRDSKTGKCDYKIEREDEPTK